MQPSTRFTMLRLHRWIGLATALLLFIQGMTGSLLVFRDEIEGVLHPELVLETTGSRVPAQFLADLAEEMHVGARVDRLTFGRSSNRAAMARLKDPAGESFYVALDPYQGTVLRNGDITAWPMELLFAFHHELFSGKVGTIIIGVEAILLIWLIGFGLLAWWPGTRRLRQGFRLVRGTPDRLVRSLHRTVGGLLAVLMLVSATTGVMLVFKTSIGDMIGAVAKPAPQVAARQGEPLLSLDRAVALARARVGNAALVELRLTGNHRQLLTVLFDDTRVLRGNAVDQVFVDRYSGAIVGRHHPARLPTPNTILDWAYTVHTGEALGLLGRLFALASGIVLLLFSVSGFWLWLSRTRQARAKCNAKSTQRAVGPIG